MRPKFLCDLKIAYCVVMFNCIALVGCNTTKITSLTVQNKLDFPRKEVVSIPYKNLLNVLDKQTYKSLHIKVNNTRNYQETQWVDYDNDGIPEEFLFQAEVPANGISYYTLIIDSSVVEPQSNVRTFSRFVPERTDDYTWENDKVAFRTYGPQGQKGALEGNPGSTLSSGIDLWLKRTKESIINKWYSENLRKPGYYHIDHGEGYDPYHVGKSRGTGGLGVWENGILYVSQNYTEYNRIAVGPLRTVFELRYAPWSPYNINETKRITLDLGSNFSKFDVKLSAENTVPNYTIGLTLHENKGDFKLNKKNGWFRHWEKIDDSYVGEGIVLDVNDIDSAFVQRGKDKDQNHILIVTKPQNTLSYYAGFAWVKSGQISNVEDWESLLEKQSKIIETPLEISIQNKFYD
jgi:hypothetical protein